MGEKGQFRRHIPAVKLWFVLCLTLAFSVVLLAAAHLTHSLTLRVEAYHALYNLLSLTGCLLTMKLCSRPESLHNTFGWARLEVLSMLTTLIFLTALCFSMAIDSIQTALHAGHQDAMHHPLHIMGLGVVGLVLNGIVYCLIGGYTHHQGCFLELRGSGGVWVGKQLTQEAVQTGRRTLSLGNLNAGSAKERLKEVMRDISGLILVELCAAVVQWDNGETIALYIDPALAITSAAVLMWLSYPYGRECCQILLQTIPGHINVEDFKSRILDEFPDILNVHHLHIWTFTPTKVVATAHVVFLNKKVYLSTHAALREFFLDEGVTQVTLQPEFAVTDDPSKESNVCLLRCKNHHCHEKECCRGCISDATPLSAVTTGENEDGENKGTETGEPGKQTLPKITDTVLCTHGKNVCLTFKFSESPQAGLQEDKDPKAPSGMKEPEPVHKPLDPQRERQDADRISERVGSEGEKKKKTVGIRE